MGYIGTLEESILGRAAGRVLASRCGTRPCSSPWDVVPEPFPPCLLVLFVAQLVAAGRVLACGMLYVLRVLGL